MEHVHARSLIHLDPVTAMTKTHFFVEIEETHDLTGLRNHRFLQRGVEPVYKPMAGHKAHSNIPIHLIVDILHKGSYIQFNSDQDLFDIVSILESYLKLFKDKIANANKNSDEYLFIERCQKAYRQLTELANERLLLMKKRSKTHITGLDRLRNRI